MDPRALDFESEIKEGRIAVPPEIVAQVPAGAQIRVVVSWGQSQEDAEWRATGRLRFEAAYCEADAIYDSLTDDPPTR